MVLKLLSKGHDVQMEALKAMMNRNASMMVNMLDNRPPSARAGTQRRPSKSSPFDYDDEQ